jgi:LPS export ABC transporter protein LptC
MIRRFVLITVTFVFLYVVLIQWKVWNHSKRNIDPSVRQGEDVRKDGSQQVYSFSFSKYTEAGVRELEIEGDSADILSEKVKLINVIAKAYAEESPITITADRGSFNKSTNDIWLEKNVVATTEDGIRLITEELLIHPDANRMETDIEAKVKKDNIHIQGMGAKSDSDVGTVTFRKNVTVVVQDPNSDTNNPTVITCDGPLEIDYKKNVAYFKEDVVAQDERGTLSSDFMDVFYNGASRRVSKMIATGNVVIETKEGNKTYSDNAIYLAEEGRIILGGDVNAQYLKEESVGEANWP